MRSLYLSVGLAMLLVCLMTCGDQNTTQESRTKSLNPDGKARIRGMSDLLAAAPALRITTSETHEWRTVDGEPAKVEGEVETTIWRPDGLYIKARATGTKEIDHELYYDGWILVLENHVRNVWAAADVPPTIDQMLDQVAWRFNLPVPVADMLYSSPYDSLMTDDTQVRFAGQEVMNNSLCDHFVCSQSIVDWEIWISAEGDPIPHCVDIIHKTLDGAPRSRLVFSAIELAPEVSESIFTFIPRDGYTEVPVVENPPPAEAVIGTEDTRSADDKRSSS